eukprot:4706429-Alexandrium_andersonii.AAC.1
MAGAQGVVSIFKARANELQVSPAKLLDSYKARGDVPSMSTLAKMPMEQAASIARALTTSAEP